jgi:hypothetical protein
MTVKGKGGWEERAVRERRENPAQLEEERRGEKTAVCLSRSVSSFERVKVVSTVLLNVFAHVLDA